MVLLLHISIALTSLAVTTLTYIRPSAAKLRLSRGFIAATVASGFYLVVSLKTAILRTCITGLLYVGVLSVGIYLAERKLARAEIITSRPTED